MYTRDLKRCDMIDLETKLDDGITSNMIIEQQLTKQERHLTMEKDVELVEDYRSIEFQAIFIYRLMTTIMFCTNCRNQSTLLTASSSWTSLINSTWIAFEINLDMQTLNHFHLWTAWALFMINILIKLSIISN